MTKVLQWIRRLNQEARWIHIGSSVILVIIGVMFIVSSNRLERTIRLLLAIYFVVSSLYHLSRVVKTKKRDELLRLIVDVVGAIITVFFTNLLVSMFNILIGIYMILVALINAVDYYVKRLGTQKGAVWALLSAICSMLLGILMIIFNSYDFYLIDLAIGMYFLLKGGTDLLRQIVNLLPIDKQHAMYSRFSVSAPVFVEAVLPIVAYTSVPKLKASYGATKEDLQPIRDHCVEVWIHLNDHGFEQFGHVDVGYGSTIYSYGAHDPLSRQIAGSVGLGVLLVVDRKAFLDYCVNAGETILCYTLQLSEENEKLLNDRLAQLMNDAQNYDCLLKRELDNGQQGKAHDYASRVYKATHAKMYTFLKGPFRWYYVFKTNCVQLADYLLRNGQFFLIQSSGIITPGSYITYLTQELRSEQGYVSDLKIYSKE